MELSDKIENFNTRFDKSKDKAVFLENEIKSYELLFDEKKLPLSTEVISGSRPIKYLNFYTHHDIILIREAYQRYIVNGTDVDEAGEMYLDKKDKIYKRYPLSAFQIHYYHEVNMLFEYLKFLKHEATIKLMDGSKTQQLVVTESKEAKSSRRQVAFCIYLLFKSKRFDISTLNRNSVKIIVDNNFKGIASDITVKNTLFGYDLDKGNEKAFFNFKGRRWEYQEDNFNYMINNFPNDYKKALEMIEKFK